MAHAEGTHASKYLPAPGLEEAADVACRLGMPLLLTGEPGVGKTQAAFWLAGKLGLDLLEYAVRSIATFSDLFYGYNGLAHYHAAGLASRAASPVAPGPAAPARAQESPVTTALRFIDFHALGVAILRAADPEKMEGYYTSPKPGKTRSVVLLDEIDKAPRDLPNDVLRAVETMEFSIPELGGWTVAAAPKFRPVVVCTSNSERGLPDAFLRRCIYYHIPFPKEPELKAIVQARLGLPPESEQVAHAVATFAFLRDQGLRKAPATAELLDFLRAVRGGDGQGHPPVPSTSDRWKSVALACLVKTEEDRAAAEEALKRWSPDTKGVAR